MGGAIAVTEEVATEWRRRIDVVSARCPSGAPADALLIRPDGYVAWAGASSDGLNRALRQWFSVTGPRGSVDAPSVARPVAPTSSR
jgi:hypothetical protein